MHIIKQLFSISGRMNRKTYVLQSMIVGILVYSLSIGFELASNTNPDNGVISVSWGAIILSLYVQAAMLTNRIRDTGSSTSLVWIYYGGILFGIPLLLFGFVSKIALAAGFLLFGISIIITLYAVFAGSAADENESKSGKSTFDDLSSSDQSENFEGQHAFNANADAIIAKAVAERQEAQNSNKKYVHKLSNPNGQRLAEKSRFGKRATPAFGQR